MQLNLYSISDKYVDYLRKFDNRVYDNKEEIRVHTRKYLGIVLSINSFNYIIFLFLLQKLQTIMTKIRLKLENQ